MDIYSSIVTALALGAAIGFKSTAEQAIKDAYEALKSLIGRKYPRVDLAALEEKPDSEDHQMAVTDDLTKVDAAHDKELLEKVDELFEALRASEGAHKIIGVKIDDVEAASLTIKDVISSGSGVTIARTKIEKDINIEGVQAGDTPPKKKRTRKQ